MAPGEPGDGEPQTAHRPVLGERAQCILAARWGKPASGPEQWADIPPVTPDRQHKQPGRRGDPPHL